jgi:hypothetical protein
LAQQTVTATEESEMEEEGEEGAVMAEGEVGVRMGVGEGESEVEEIPSQPSQRP